MSKLSQIVSESSTNSRTREPKTFLSTIELSSLFVLLLVGRSEESRTEFSVKVTLVSVIAAIMTSAVLAVTLEECMLLSACQAFLPTPPLSPASLL